MPDLFKQSLQFRKFFDTRKSKLSESEFGSFKSFVEKVRKVVTTLSSRFARHQNPAVSHFRNLLTDYTATLLGKEDKKIDLVEGLSGSSAVLLINDVTENLSTYVQGKSAAFSKSLYLRPSWCLLILCVSFRLFLR